MFKKLLNSRKEGKLLKQLHIDKIENVEKPILEGAFGSAGYAMCEMNYPTLFEKAKTYSLKLTKDEVQKLEMVGDVVIPLFREPNQIKDVIVYRFDEEVGLKDHDDGTWSQILKDSLLVFYSFEENGKHYAIEEYHQIINNEASNPLPEFIREFSGERMEFIKLWEKMINKKHHLVLGNFSFHREI